MSLAVIEENLFLFLSSRITKGKPFSPIYQIDYLEVFLVFNVFSFGVGVRSLYSRLVERERGCMGRKHYGCCGNVGNGFPSIIGFKSLLQGLLSRF
jgi:hypothetical protein